ncbi:PREDICTED: FAS-associated death domain protein [Chaetura pelagica]|uniref:FAS-associated death domain protein n=1 Tax=Chaetura pelagica TaxID=8897 RepID=UPI000523CF68|nr:PREDICTED: FAS-associated death domain protein [Chaetura pelagica]
MEHKLTASDRLELLEELLKEIKREDLVSRLHQFVEDGEVTAPEEQPDAHEKRRLRAAIEIICDNVAKDWKRLVRKLGVSEVQIERIIVANPCNLHEQFTQSLLQWQRWKGRDAKASDLIKALRECHLNLVADTVEQKLKELNPETR